MPRAAAAQAGSEIEVHGEFVRVRTLIDRTDLVVLDLEPVLDEGFGKDVPVGLVESFSAVRASIRLNKAFRPCRIILVGC